MKTLTVIAPVYNEQDIIAKFYEALRFELAKEHDYRSRIILVVDPGTDNTVSVLRALAKNDLELKVITLSRRFGHQASLIAGIDYADADAVVMLDADLQHPPDVIHSLLRGYEEGFDIVQTIRAETENIGFFKNISSKLYYKVLNSLSEVPITTAAADFRLMSRRVIETIKNNFKERNMFLRGVVGWVGYRTKFIEFKAPDREAGATKYTFIRLLRFGLTGIVAFSRKPLRLAFLFGTSLFIAGLISSVLLLIFTPSWLSIIVSLIAIIGGIQLLFLGVIGEYVGAVYEEVKGRPLYIVDEVINL